MKKLIDILIVIIVLLIFLSFYFKGWLAFAFASGAVVLVFLAFLLNKKS
ncbi:MAG: hypothetical protein J6D11_03450 [Clostridia bacterium]|nr:hypothetical protein [Clostridia bacterium]